MMEKVSNSLSLMKHVVAELGELIRPSLSHVALVKKWKWQESDLLLVKTPHTDAPCCRAQTACQLCWASSGAARAGGRCSQGLNRLPFITPPLVWTVFITTLEKRYRSVLGSSL